jgi:Domain of unknown function (DUF4386)
MRKDWWTPLAGVAFLVVLIVSFLVGGEPPDASEPAQEIVDHYVDNKDAVQIGAALSTLAALLLVFFAGILRRVLRAAEGVGGTLSAVAFAGAIIMATGAAIDASISFALADRAEDIDPVAVQALQALWDNDFFPIALGSSVLLLGAGLSIVRHGALPRWLGWVGIVLAVIGMTPIGFVGFLGGALWVLVVSVLLTLRMRAEAPPAPVP